MIYYIISFCILISISIGIGVFVFYQTNSTQNSETETEQEISTELENSEEIPTTATTATTNSSPTTSYKFYQGMDVGRYDIIGQKNAAIDNIEELKRLCNEDPTCVAFNTNGWLKWNVGSRTEWSKWTDNANKGSYVKTTINILPKPQEWQCLLNIKTPLSLTGMGDVQCMSPDRKNCMWSNTIEECNKVINDNKNKTIKPLVCGEMHKNAHGSTGYDNPEHWCARGKNIFS